MATAKCCTFCCALGTQVLQSHVQLSCAAVGKDQAASAVHKTGSAATLGIQGADLLPKMTIDFNQVIQGAGLGPVHEDPEAGQRNLL